MNSGKTFPRHYTFSADPPLASPPVSSKNESADRMSADGEGSERAQEFQNLDPPQGRRPRRGRCSDLPVRFRTLRMIASCSRNSEVIGSSERAFEKPPHRPRDSSSSGKRSEGIFAIVAGLFAPLIGGGGYTGAPLRQVGHKLYTHDS